VERALEAAADAGRKRLEIVILELCCAPFWPFSTLWGKETRFGRTLVLTIMAGVVQTARLADLFAVPAPLRLRSFARSRWR
jgi:hypothetical protein